MKRVKKETNVKRGESLNDFDHNHCRSICPQTLSVPRLSWRRIQPQILKPAVIFFIRRREASVHHNSPTTVKLVACVDVPPVMVFAATQEYRPLSLVELVWRVSTPVTGCPLIGCPSRCQEKMAAGNETEVQVTRTVSPTFTSPPPTHCFGLSTVSTGVSGPSGWLVIRHLLAISTCHSQVSTIMKKER